MSLLKLKTKLAVFTRATMPKNTSVVPKHTKTPLGGTNYPELDDIEINPVHGKQIADSYEALKHNPNDPLVKESYDALINETKQQYDELIKGGLKIDPILDNSNAYKNSDEMHLDLEKNKHINFFPTEQGFGSGENKYGDHPMLQPSGIKLKDKELLNNDIFRIVHDVQGHYRGQASGFGPKGEQQAFLTHSQMFSDKARRALFTETAGQNNWVNFGPKGEHNRKNPKDTIFAEQKAGLLPDDIVFGEWHRAKRKTAKEVKYNEKPFILRYAARPPPLIKPIKYFAESNSNIIKMKPKEFLDKTSSSGLEDSLAQPEKYDNKIQHNSGILSDVGGVHSDNPKSPYSRSVEQTNIDIFDKEPKNTVNPILGTGSDDRPSYRRYDMDTRRIFRGDELGSIEFLKRQIRHGEPIERPMIDVDRKGIITEHEGRHRSRALMEEGIPEEEVTVYGEKIYRDIPEAIKGQKDSLDEIKRDADYFKDKSYYKRKINIYDEENDKFKDVELSGATLKERLQKIKEDTRHPIFGRSAKQKIAVKFTSSFGPDLDAIDAFKKGVDYQGFTGKGKNKRLKFEVANGGTELRLHGHVIAKKTKNGIAVSNAGFDTGLTYSALKELGVNAKRLPNGRVQLHNKEIDAISGNFIDVPLNEISKTPIRATKPISKNKNPNRTVTEQSNFRNKVLQRELSEQNQKQLPLSTTTIQPKDQRLINKITGIKSKIPKKSLATDAHHIFPVSKFPGLRNNPNIGIMQTRKEHTELERLNPPSNFRRFAKLRAKLALIEPIVLKKKKPKVIKKVNVKEGMMQTAKMLSADAIMNKFIEFRRRYPNSLGSGVFDPIENRILDARIPLDAIRLQRFFESGTKKIGFNSITDTRQGPATDVELIRSQLREVEQSGGIPALGFDEGSLEALNVITRTTDTEILNDLKESQRSTGILDGDLTFRILDNDKFKQN